MDENLMDECNITSITGLKKDARTESEMGNESENSVVNSQSSIDNVNTVIDTSNQTDPEQPINNNGDVTKDDEEIPGMNLTDEYHYVKSGEYTSEMFKVVVQNIPSKITYGVCIIQLKRIFHYSNFFGIISQRKHFDSCK